MDTVALSAFISQLVNTSNTSNRPAGLIEPGNINLSNRPNIINQDGSISTVRTLGVNIDGQEVLIPKVVGKRVVSDEEAIEHFRRTGQHLGKFDTPENSTSFAKQLSAQESERIRGPSNSLEVFIRSLLQ